MTNSVESLKQDGKFPKYAWPGGYDILYVMDDGETLCADCMNDASNPIHFKGEADGWRVDGYSTSDWSEGEETCAHCYRVIVEGDAEPIPDPEEPIDAVTQGVVPWTFTDKAGA